MESYPDSPLAFSDDLRHIFGALRRRFWLFLLLFLLVLSLAAAYLYLTVPLYTAVATIVLDPRKQVVTNSPEVLSDVAPDSSVIDTQVQLIKSRTVLGNAVDRLNRRAERDRVPAAPGAATVAAAEGAIAGSATGAVTDITAGLGTTASADTSAIPDRASDVDASARDAAIDFLGLHADVSRVGLSSAIHISYEDPDPRHSSDVANAISAAYLNYQTELKQRATREATQWLRQQVNDLQVQVRAADAAVDTFRSGAGLLTARGATSTESQVTTLDVGLNDARQALSEARVRLASYKSALQGAGAAEAAKILATPLMQQLRTQYSLLANQRAQVSSTLGPQHPQMVELNRQIDALQEQVNAEARRTLIELQSESDIAESKVAGLLAIRDQSRSQLAKDNAATVQLAQLQANANSVRLLYEGLLTRLQQTSAQETLGQVNATVVSEATVPTEPSSPRLNLILTGACIIGLVLGSFGVLLAELLERTIRRPKDFELLSHIPVLGLVPELKSGDLRVGGKRASIVEIVPKKPISLFAESFRNVRVAVLDAVNSDESVALQVTSGTFAEGKTICSIALAQTVAMDGRRVLLVDADIRRRCLTEYLGVTPELGLMEVLTGRAQLSDVIIKGGAGEPDVLPLSTVQYTANDGYSPRQLDTLLQTLKHSFDVIVFDSAPVLAVAESLTLATRVDAVLLVARWSKTPVSIVMKALEEINRVGGHVAGSILTRVDLRRLTKQTHGRAHYPAMVKYYGHK